jgi:hypothetical protein
LAFRPILANGLVLSYTALYVLPLLQITAQLGVIGITLNTVLKKYMATSNNLVTLFHPKEKTAGLAIPCWYFGNPAVSVGTQHVFRPILANGSALSPAATYAN